MTPQESNQAEIERLEEVVKEKDERIKELEDEVKELKDKISNVSYYIDALEGNLKNAIKEL